MSAIGKDDLTTIIQAIAEAETCALLDRQGGMEGAAERVSKYKAVRERLSGEGEQEEPVLTLSKSDDQGTDFVLAEGQSCWVTVSGASLHIIDSGDGVSVSLFSSSDHFANVYDVMSADYVTLDQFADKHAGEDLS